MLFSFRNFAMLTSRKYFNFIERDYRSEYGEHLIRALPDNIVSPSIEMLLIKVKDIPDYFLISRQMKNIFLGSSRFTVYKHHFNTIT